MALATQQIAASLDTIAANIGEADKALDTYVGSGCEDEWYASSVKWYLELAYAQLLTLAEALQLPLLRADIARDLEAAKAERLTAIDRDPDGDAHLKWAAPARRHVRTIQSTFAAEPSRTVTKDLESILRAATYSITDRKVFGNHPQDERAVHLRLEAVLKCVFPDLKPKPTLTKPIKNFVPDTGIPSIQTLIEYKFLASEEAAAQIADELLADSRGYTSREWTSFVYVIYETQRFRPESQWRQFLRDCGIDERTIVIVISGEPLDDNRTCESARQGGMSPVAAMAGWVHARSFGRREPIVDGGLERTTRVISFSPAAGLAD
ncbi:MAG TPA: hypothetical protein VF121_04045 [Thermoanaerobaculia bacterium]|nr:hypothetical protein [Thermoanaerobaculia bacterium]